MKELASIASSPRRIRKYNEIAALKALYQFGRLSRADLARKLQLNRSSSGHIIAELTAGGLVREGVDDKMRRPGKSQAGRPGIMLELAPEAVFFIGVEIGVEHISAVQIDLAAKIISSVVEPFDGPALSIEAAVERAVELAFHDIPAARLERCEGFGIATPSQMDRNGTVRVAPLLGWRNVNLAKLAQRHLPVPLPVLAENDANAFAIGATYGHNGGGEGVTLFIVLESGVGGGIVIDGNLFRGGHGLAGEIGHLRMSSDPAHARTLEQLIGLESILGQYRTITGRENPSLAEFLAEVRDRVPGAVSIAEDWARHLAFALVQACRIIDADSIVLGGSVAELYPLVAARVAAHMEAAQEASFPLPALSLNSEATFGSTFGAACMMHQRYLSLESQRFSEAATAAENE